jgi:hypothetical protein
MLALGEKKDPEAESFRNKQKFFHRAVETFDGFTFYLLRVLMSRKICQGGGTEKTGHSKSMDWSGIGS